MFACIKGFSDVASSLDMLRGIAECDLEQQTRSWYARVPTEANIADGPSRLDFKEAGSLLGAELVQVPDAMCEVTGGMG